MIEILWKDMNIIIKIKISLKTLLHLLIFFLILNKIISFKNNEKYNIYIFIYKFQYCHSLKCLLFLLEINLNFLP